MASDGPCCMTITSVSTPDPYVVFAHDTFYLTFTSGDRVEIWSSPTLLGFYAYPEKTIIWKPRRGAPFSGDIWAPELHALRGRWYIYVSCDHPLIGNASHRVCVLRGPASSVSPCAPAATWDFLGPLPGLPSHQWSIDGTVLQLHGELYCVYSGWPLRAGYPGQSAGPGVPVSSSDIQTPADPDPLRQRIPPDAIQELYIIRLASPERATGFPVRIAAPERAWEFSGARGIAEGPQYLAAPDGSWRGLAYSCAGSWTREYKMATLRYVGGEPLNPRAWVKGEQPLLRTWEPEEPREGRNGGGKWGREKRQVGPFGPGHGSFVQVTAGLSGTADEEGGMLCVFHATDRPDDGWDGRKARVQRVRFTFEGPDMGRFVGRITTDVRELLGNVEDVSADPPSPRGEKEVDYGHAEKRNIRDRIKGLWISLMSWFRSRER